MKKKKNAKIIKTTIIPQINKWEEYDKWEEENKTNIKN